MRWTATSKISTARRRLRRRSSGSPPVQGKCRCPCCNGPRAARPVVVDADENRLYARSRARSDRWRPIVSRRMRAGPVAETSVLHCDGILISWRERASGQWRRHRVSNHSAHRDGAMRDLHGWARTYTCGHVRTRAGTCGQVPNQCGQTETRRRSRQGMT